MIKNYLIVIFLFGFLGNAQQKTERINVYFESNSSELTENDKTTITTFFSRENLTLNTIEVLGFCDDIGSTEANKKLSESRATSVSEFIKNNFGHSSISSFGKGEISLESTTPNIEDSRKNNRKVTISITYSESKNKIKPLESAKPKLPVYKTFNDKLTVGDKVIMKKLLFKGSLTHYDDEEQAEVELGKVVSYLNENPNTSIEIQGHVCCITKSHGDAYDRETKMANLSQTRAKKIFDYLVSKGISEKRMTHKGYGRKHPISGGIESDNKRVEILITKT
jgi:outer membrane protein OmpA-like peptidoglycan-associated protein